jgi:glutamate--cysteine ligase
MTVRLLDSKVSVGSCRLARVFETSVINNGVPAGAQASLADPVLGDGLIEGQPLSEAAAEGWVPRTCFKHGPPGQTGLELEFVVHDRSQHEHLSPQRLAALHTELLHAPVHGRITTEPGGQVELSSQPAADLPTAVREVEADLSVITAIAQRHQARLVGAGIDPLPPPPRTSSSQRYDAMEAYLGAWGSAGIAMMRSTASVQLNVEAGRAGRDETDLLRRWHVLHAIGPALTAAFSTSSQHEPAGRSRSAAADWHSCANLRQGVWQSLDPARCQPLVIAAQESLPQAWARWALDAPLLLVARPGPSWSAPRGLTFRQWLRAGQPAIPDRGPATLDDLQRHLTTLFPPVRARGHLEVRYLDAQPGRWWRVPAAVVAALLDDDDDAGDAALALTEPVSGAGPGGAAVWQSAARTGLGDSALASAATGLMGLARDTLHRTGRPPEQALAVLVEQYRERWTARGHTPGTRPETSEDAPW